VSVRSDTNLGCTSVALSEVMYNVQVPGVAGRETNGAPKPDGKDPNPGGPELGT